MAPEGLRISVTDRGPGIPAPDVARATERFYRGETARHTPGFGLGLTLVRAVAQLHGGTLSLEDAKPGLQAVLTIPSPADARAGRLGSIPAAAPPARTAAMLPPPPRAKVIPNAGVGAMDDGRVVLTRHRLDVEAYYRMAEAGILGEDDRIELIEGELIDMAPIGQDHAATVNSLTESPYWPLPAGRSSRRRTRSVSTGSTSRSPTSPCSGCAPTFTGLASGPVLPTCSC